MTRRESRSSQTRRSLARDPHARPDRQAFVGVFVQVYGLKARIENDRLSSVRIADARKYFRLEDELDVFSAFRSNRNKRR
jgi:hypothetical protein